MNDRELLERAAKAAGIDPALIDLQDDYDKPAWNPLSDDGDALRLAVKLGIGLDCTNNRCWAFTAGMAINGVCEEFYGAAPYAATRRAIVRAAAAMAEKP